MTIFNKIVDESTINNYLKQPCRDYIGASSIGHDCPRHVQLQYLDAINGQHIPANALQIRTFDIGHTLEDLCAQWLKNAGFQLLTKNENGEQFSFSDVQGKFAGHVDGIIYNIGDIIKPEIKALGTQKIYNPLNHTTESFIPTTNAYNWILRHDKAPTLWENKTMNSHNWLETAKKGVFIAKKIYYVQVQIYMAYLGLEMCLFTALNKNTSELYFELIPFDPETAQKYIDKTVQIFQAIDNHELLPRCSQNPEFFLCKMCGLYQKCWSEKC